MQFSSLCSDFLYLFRLVHLWNIHSECPKWQREPKHLWTCPNTEQNITVNPTPSQFGDKKKNIRDLPHAELNKEFLWNALPATVIRAGVARDAQPSNLEIFCFQSWRQPVFAADWQETLSLLSWSRQRVGWVLHWPCSGGWWPSRRLSARPCARWAFCSPSAWPCPGPSSHPVAPASAEATTACKTQCGLLLVNCYGERKVQICTQLHVKHMVSTDLKVLGFNWSSHIIPILLVSECTLWSVLWCNSCDWQLRKNKEKNLHMNDYNYPSRVSW